MLVDRLEGAGYRIKGRASKAVSDALRWEAAHGRVVRLGRGRYDTGRIPRSTIAWLRACLDRCRTAEPVALVEPVSPVSSPSDRDPGLQPDPDPPTPGSTADTASRLSARAIQHRWDRERQRRRERRGTWTWTWTWTRVPAFGRSLPEALEPTARGTPPGC